MRIPFLAAAAALCAACTAAPPKVATDELFRAIEPGMTQDEVRRALGAPHESMAFARSRTVAWDYEYQDTWGYIAVFSVTFGPDGRAVSSFSRRVNDGGDHAN